MNFEIRKFYDGDFGSAIGSAASGFAMGGPVGAGIGLAASLLPSIIGLIGGGKQKRAAAQAQKQADGYYNQANTYGQKGLDVANQNYATNQNAYNGRMAGATNLEGNINANQAGTLASMGRNATDSSQLLALAGGVQGNTNQAFNQLGMDEAQNKFMQGMGLSNAAYGVQMANDNLQNLNFNRANQMQQAANMNGQAGQINQYNAAKGLGNVGMMLGQGAFGSFGGQDSGGDGGGVSGSALGGLDDSNLIPFNANPGIPNLGYNFFQRQTNPFR